MIANTYYLANYVDIRQQPLEKPVFVFKPLETEQLLTVSYLSLLKSVARDLLNSVYAGKYHQYCTFQYQLFFKLVFWILHNNVYTLCLSLNTLDSCHQLINTDEMVVSFKGHIQNVHYLENHNSNVHKKGTCTESGFTSGSSLLILQRHFTAEFSFSSNKQT